LRPPGVIYVDRPILTTDRVPAAVGRYREHFATVWSRGAPTSVPTSGRRARALRLLWPRVRTGRPATEARRCDRRRLHPWAARGSEQLRRRGVGDVH
jgi:hypothetical protein